MDRFARKKAFGAGMTLLELLIVLLIVAALLGLSMPGFGELVASKRGDIIMDRLRQAVSVARTSAVTSGTLTTLCRSADALTCGGSWEEGLLIFHDEDGNRQLEEGQAPVRYVELGDTQGRLYWRAFQNRQYLQFTPLGFTRYQNGNFTYCPDSGDLRHARQLILNRTGRLRVAVDSDGDGIAEDSRGRPLRC
ncbi:MAG: GspH/FimT family protein [Pseudohongiellaceae bacterium]